MKTAHWIVISLVLCAGIMVVATRSAQSCASVWSQDGSGGIQIADETAVIVWNEKTKTEDFIRKADFNGAESDFGFLVPTPTAPKLKEFDRYSFDTLDELTAPKIIYHRDNHYVAGSVIDYFIQPRSRSTSSSLSATPMASVRVEDTANVAGYKAVVLSADNPGSLAKWLTDNDYTSRPGLANWLKPYVAARWKITAFKFLPTESNTSNVTRFSSKTSSYVDDLVQSKAVRMTFSASEPMFPYREPADAREPGGYSPNRLLRIYFIGKSRESASINALNAPAWPGTTTWANQLPFHSHSRTAKWAQIAMPDKPYLTVFEDASSPRPGIADLKFVPATVTANVTPPDVIETIDREVIIPVDLLIGLAVIVGIGSIVAVGKRRVRYRRSL